MRLIFTWGIIIVTCFVNFAILSAGAFGSLTASAEVVKNNASEKVIDEQPKSVSDIHEQITLLEAQNRLLREHNQSLLTTVHWALAFAAVFLIAVFGLMGYFTYRRYEQDKESLKNFLDSEITKIRAGFTDRLSEWKRKSADNLRKETEILKQSLNNIAESKSNEAISPVKTRINSLSRDLNYLQIGVIKLEAEDWKKKGIKGNVVSCWFRIAQKGLSIKQDWIVSDALNEMERLLKQGAKFSAAQVTEVTGFLQSLPPQFEALVKAIQSKI